MDNLRLSEFKRKRNNLLDKVSLKQAAISSLDDRNDYWEGVITSQRKELSRMLDEKRKQEEGDVAGTSITPRATQHTRANLNSSSRSNGPRDGATGLTVNRP